MSNYQGSGKGNIGYPYPQNQLSPGRTQPSANPASSAVLQSPSGNPQLSLASPRVQPDSHHRISSPQHGNAQMSSGPGYPQPHQPLEYPSAHTSQSFSYSHQPHQPDPAQFSNGYNGGMNQSPAQVETTSAKKPSRLRRACDLCSQRKVKCDESGPPCKACSTVGVPCTWTRANKRRGPPNRHADDFKRSLVSPPPAPEGSKNLLSPTAQNNVAATLASFSSHAVLNEQKEQFAEAICSFEVLEDLVDDFFKYVHPVIPFPHEPSFRHAFLTREDTRSPRFIALLASMISTLAASFPGIALLHFKTRNLHLFPTSLALVERCQKVAVEARGPGYFNWIDMDVHDACTSYFLGISAAHTFQWTQCRLYFGEVLTISRILGVHNVEKERQVDSIREEVARRVFWVMFISVRSMQQLGPTLNEILIPPPTPSEPYPPLPLEVDDEFIQVHDVLPQTTGIIPRVTGFNLKVQGFTPLEPLTTSELIHGIDEFFDWDKQKEILDQCLQDVQRVLGKVPEDLRLKPAAQKSPERQYPDFSDAANSLAASQAVISPFEIQKFDIYVSQLGTRTYLINKYWTLYEKAKSRSISVQENTEEKLVKEHQEAVQDLLHLLGSIKHSNLELGGSSLIYKIRQIASALLNSPHAQKGSVARDSEQYLAQFMDILGRLDRINPGVGASGFGISQADSDESEEARSWAALKQLQGGGL